MSMNGASLADWQTITEGINERIQAVWFDYAIGLLPVPSSKDHITAAFVNQIGNLILSFFGQDGWVETPWVDPDQPLVIIDPSSPYWDPTYQTGRAIYNRRRWTPTLQEIDTRPIYATLPECGSVPLRASVLANLGPFLDMCADALALLTKEAAANPVGPLEVSRAAFSWDPITGEIRNTNTYALVGSASTFADFYAFALANVTTTTETGDPQCITNIYNNGSLVFLRLEYSSGRIIGRTFTTQTTPGGIRADMTVYYKSTGDDCGIPVNTTSTHLDFSTVSHSNVGPETPISIGFDASNVSTVPTMPTAGNSYTRQENLSILSAVWDFSNYFQH